jgi:hypothetical protein
MSLHTDLQSTIGQTTRHLRGVEERTEARLRGINLRGTRELLKIARNLVHERTGRLKAGLIIEGPYDVASGTLEARVAAPTVVYAAEEAKRGGEHDYATRTLEAGQGVIDKVADDMERAIVEEMNR